MTDGDDLREVIRAELESGDYGPDVPPGNLLAATRTDRPEDVGASDVLEAARDVLDEWNPEITDGGTQTTTQPPDPESGPNIETDRPEMNGPPEPVVSDDGDPKIVSQMDTDPTGLKIQPLTELECQRCGYHPVEVDIVNGDIQPPYECPNSSCQREGPFAHPVLEDYPEIDIGAYVDPQWHTPSGANNSDFDELWSDVRAWIHTNWVADEEHLYDGLTAFAITTWLRPNLDFHPHLMVMGKHAAGKTRLLQTVARVAYRGRVPVSFTPASMFRTIDAYNISLFLSEYHDLREDLRDEVNGVIKGSQKRGEDVMRVEKGQNGAFRPATFDIYTHMGIGTQFDPPDDIISRCIQIQTTPADRDVPVRFDEDRATELRNRLLWARFKLLDSEEWDEAEQGALEWLNERDIDGRLREKLLCLVTVADLWGERDAISEFVDWAEEQAQTSTADSDDAIFIRATRDIAIERVVELADEKEYLGEAGPWGDLVIPLSDIADRFNEMDGRDIGPSYMGQIRKRLDLEKTRQRQGVVIDDPDLQEKLQRLCEENNLEWETTSSSGDPNTAAKQGSLPQGDRLDKIKYIIDDLEDETENGAPKSAVLDRAESAGIERSKAEHEIEKLLRQGDVYTTDDDDHLRRND